jgi:molybdate transport system ATP-binding protein
MTSLPDPAKNAIDPSAPYARPLLTLQDVSLRLYGRILLENTQWRIRAGQHWAVIGPNGSGKSTLTKALCGQVPVVKGKITYHAVEQDRIAHVSFDDQKATAQHTSHFYQERWNRGVTGESLSVYEYLVQPPKASPYQVTDQPVDVSGLSATRSHVIALLGIEDLQHKRVAQLSNGEMRKVLIAQALIRKPRLLILDNPFTGLDRQFRARLKELIESMIDGLEQDRIGIIVVTTRWDEIPPGITHVLVLEDGHVIAQGAANEITSKRPARRIPAVERTPDRVPKHDPDQTVTFPVLVRMRDVRVDYNGTPILNHVHWTIQQGENWALLGPNGSGKTTLLSLIIGDNPQAYANDISLFGRRRGSGESIWDIKKHIGWIAPELHLHYPKTRSSLAVVCSGYFDSVGLYRPCSASQRTAAKAWMRHLGISHCANTSFGSLSQGEQRMVLLARALVKRPLLLVLDEPCQGLDARNRERIVQTIDAVCTHADTNVIYVTHDDRQLPQAITHLIRLDRGNVVQAGAI